MDPQFALSLIVLQYTPLGMPDSVFAARSVEPVLLVNFACVK
jgi:hypothetical protein